MSSNNGHRVLNRMGARELSPEEAAMIGGGGNTVATPTGTGPMHHDGDFDQ